MFIHVQALRREVQELKRRVEESEEAQVRLLSSLDAELRGLKPPAAGSGAGEASAAHAVGAGAPSHAALHGALERFVRSESDGPVVHDSGSGGRATRMGSGDPHGPTAGPPVTSAVGKITKLFGR